MKKLSLALIAILGMSGFAVEWANLDEANWYSGRRLESADLIGKVVMVDQWGYNCGPCRAALPRLEEIWQTFKSKPFILLGSHCGGGKSQAAMAVIQKTGITYPVYEGAGMVGAPSNGGAIPFIYVVDAQGKVVYSGRSDREATAAVVNALTNASGTESLLGDMVLSKYKSMQRRLQLGVSCESSVSQLKMAVKSSSTKPKDLKEAKAILDAIQRAHDNLKSAIEEEVKTRPAAALDHIVVFRKTWPSEAKSMDEQYKRLAADPEVVKCAKLRQAVKKWRDYDPRNANDAKRALAAVQSQIVDSAALKESANAGVASEAKSCLGELEEVSKDLAAAAVPSRKK